MPRGSFGRTEGVLVDFDGEGGEGRDGVDAAGGEENEAGAVGLAELEHVHRAPEVVLDELAGARFAVHAGEDARVGGGIDDPVDGGERFEVARGAEIAVEEFNAEFFQGVAVGLAAGADKIVEADESVAGAGFGEGAREGAADKAAHTGDQDSHGRSERESEGGRESESESERESEGESEVRIERRIVGSNARWRCGVAIFTLPFPRHFHFHCSA